MGEKVNRSGTKAIILVFSKVITLLMSTVTAMILARALSLDEYGTYSELLTISSIGVSIFSLGLPNALNYFLPQYRMAADKRKFIGFYYLIVTVMAAAVMLIMALANRPIAAYYDNPRLVTYSYFLVIVPWTKLIISSRSNMLVAEGQVIREVVYCVLNGLCLVGIPAFCLISGKSFDTYIVLYVITESVFALLVYLEAFRISGKKIHIRFDVETVKELLRYTIPLGLSTAISTISLDLDKLIIGYIMDEESVAIYANAGKELPFSLISASFTAVFLPQIVKWVKNGQLKLAVARWKDIMVLNYIVLAFFVGASVVFAPQVVALLYSETYLPGTGIFRIYSFTLLLRITYWAMMLNAFGRTKEILFNSLACLLVNAVLSVSLYWCIGFAGPALATVLSIFAMVVFQIIRTTKLLHVTVREMIPFREFLIPSLVCLASGWVVNIFLKKVGIGTDQQGIIYVFGVAIVWGLIYFGAFGKKLLHLWRSMNIDAEK